MKGNAMTDSYAFTISGTSRIAASPLKASSGPDVVFEPVFGRSIDFIVSLADNRPFSLSVFGVSGQKEWVYRSGVVQAGSYRLPWNNADNRGMDKIPEGGYIMLLKQGDSRLVRRFVVLRQ
jgi:hypothetical protein